MLLIDARSKKMLLALFDKWGKLVYTKKNSPSNASVSRFIDRCRSECAGISNPDLIGVTVASGIPAFMTESLEYAKVIYN